MKRVEDPKRLNQYIQRHAMDEIFTQDMRSIMELFLFKKNEHICRESEGIHYIFFFVEGRAKVYTTLSNGKSLLLCFYENFKILGDVEFVGLQNASTNIQVIEDTYCIGIPLERARSYLINDAKFLRFICNSLGGKLNQCAKNSSINLLYPLESRLASYILATGKHTDFNDKDTIEIHENLTELAELLGTSYRHLLRTLNILISKQIIRKSRQTLQVTDRLALEELAGDLYR
ncbi:cyclic nucleotide-binding protein [Alkaliphilus metalliredigens QYMF]|uniref:Cyclic nucleotide-binding protein n=1 Tax=Alkaliphilus metalliredigens (strain QYMF) TaxID=293826 RepID=A6TN24_ALKMQ|nr:transcriptional regulator YeiL [Alkaliphilus metalliredigens]ABR47592.1 cyclic nucleotide-binding protein [Alkaliphilus metalliredigens QYMF]